MPKGGVLPDDRSKISVWIQSNCKIYAFSSVIIYVVVSQMSTKRNIFRRFILYKMSRKYGLEISIKAQIGKGLYLGHPYNITVAEGTQIGENVNLHKGCTIGRTNRGNVGVPKIGNCVFIGINATVVGNVMVGDDVLIAPNSYVNFDVPAHSVVIGNPATIHHRENATERYVGFIDA